MNIHDFYRPILLHFRRKRMKQFVELFQIRDACEILDVGGATFNWQIIEQKPKVILLNVDPTVEQNDEQFTFVQGDARHMSYQDQQFDIIYSNSVIEHVGGPAEQQQFADEVRRVGASYYVQTPNKRFLIEPHFITVGLHWLPFAIKRKLLRWFSVWGWITKPSPGEIDEFIRSIRLLTVAEMRSLFPDAQIIIERFLFMPKSIIAIKLAPQAARGETSSAQASLAAR